MTDIAKFKSDDPNNSIRNWMRNRETLEFLGIWEQLQRFLLHSLLRMPLVLYNSDLT